MVANNSSNSFIDTFVIISINPTLTCSHLYYTTNPTKQALPYQPDQPCHFLSTPAKPHYNDKKPAIDPFVTVSIHS